MRVGQVVAGLWQAGGALPSCGEICQERWEEHWQGAMCMQSAFVLVLGCACSQPLAFLRGKTLPLEKQKGGGPEVQVQGWMHDAEKGILGLTSASRRQSLLPQPPAPAEG